MHDPMVVAHEVKIPILKHQGKWTDERYKGRRWGWTRRRFTHPTEDAGRPIYRWWRPEAWSFAIAGRVYAWRLLVTIWHVEPGGRDSGEVCKHHTSTQRPDGTWEHRYPTGWKWHVHHWHLQVPALQSLRATLFDRCAECGRKGRPNHGYMSSNNSIGWRKWRSRPNTWHSECMSLRHLRQSRTDDEALIQHLVAAYRVATDEDEADVVERLTRSDALPFMQKRRLWTVLGYERGPGYELIRKERAS